MSKFVTISDAENRIAALEQENARLKAQIQSIRVRLARVMKLTETLQIWVLDILWEPREGEA